MWLLGGGTVAIASLKKNPSENQYGALAGFPAQGYIQKNPSENQYGGLAGFPAQGYTPAQGRFFVQRQESSGVLLTLKHGDVIIVVFTAPTICVFAN